MCIGVVVPALLILILTRGRLGYQPSQERAVGPGETPNGGTMDKTVDSYRFISGITKRMIRSWISIERPREIPWTPLTKPLGECTVSLISSAGITLKTDRPFDQEGERRNPWWGDPSYRILPRAATSQDVRLYHLHIDPSCAEQVLNCLFPLDRLQELAQVGVIGRSAPGTTRSWATSYGRSNS